MTNKLTIQLTIHSLIRVIIGFIFPIVLLSLIVVIINAVLNGYSEGISIGFLVIKGCLMLFSKQLFINSLLQEFLVLQIKKISLVMITSGLLGFLLVFSVYAEMDLGSDGELVTPIGALVYFTIQGYVFKKYKVAYG